MKTQPIPTTNKITNHVSIQPWRYVWSKTLLANLFKAEQRNSFLYDLVIYNKGKMNENLLFRDNRGYCLSEIYLLHTANCVNLINELNNCIKNVSDSASCNVLMQCVVIMCSLSARNNYYISEQFRLSHNYRIETMCHQPAAFCSDALRGLPC